MTKQELQAAIEVKKAELAALEAQLTEVEKTEAENQDRIISEEILENGLQLTKQVVDGKHIRLYSNYHTGGDFALRVYEAGNNNGFFNRVDVYIDSELDATWKNNKGSSVWCRGYDSKRAKTIEGIIKRYQAEGIL